LVSDSACRQQGVTAEPQPQFIDCYSCLRM
jgi:hypothetical protein